MSPAAQTSPQWISVRGWRKFQHYDPSKRRPVWIKNHLDLLSRDSYRELTAPQRGVLHGIWLEYAASHCELLGTTSALSSRLGVRVTKRTLESLNHAGFIDLVASKHLAEGASPEVEVEKETSVLETNTVSSTAELVVAKRNGTTPTEPTAQTLTAEYVDACHDHHIQTPRRLIGQIAQATGQLLTEGVDPDRIRAGYRRMINRGIVQPSLLPNFVAEASIPTELRAPADGGLTGDQITEIGRRMAQ